MLRLAVAADAETLARMRDPLAERGIRAEHVQTARRVIELDEDDLGASSGPSTGASSGASTGASSAASSGTDETDDGETDTRDEFDVGFVFPPRLMEGGVADALLGVPWVNDREDVLRSRNKAGTLARLERAGVRTPETVLVSNPVEESAYRSAFDRFDPPVVVKPNSTTQGAGVTKVGDLDSFVGVVDYLDLVHDYRATADRSFLVQEYLPDARDYRAMVVDGEYVGAVRRRLPDEALAAGRWKHNVHRGAETTGVSLPADLRELAERAAGALGISWLGVDILVSGDRTVVTETNARPTIDEETMYEPGFYDRLAALVRKTATGPATERPRGETG